MNGTTLKRIFQVLTPSLSSGFISILLGVFIAGAVFVSTSYLGSYESVQVNNIQLQGISDNKLIAWYQNTYYSTLDADKLGAVPLFLFWSAIGAASYFTVAGLIQTVRDVKEIQDETEYVHMNRKSLLHIEGEKLIIRLVVLIILFVTLKFTVEQVVPWAKDLAKIGATEKGALQKVEYSLSAVFITALAMHVNVILVRLLALRVRLFGSVLPEEL